MSETGVANGTGAHRTGSHRARVESDSQAATPQGSVVRGEDRVSFGPQHPTVEYGGPRIKESSVYYPELAMNNHGPRPVPPPAEALREDAPKYDSDDERYETEQDMTKEEWEARYFTRSEGSEFEEAEVSPEPEVSQETPPNTETQNSVDPDTEHPVLFSFAPLVVLNQSEQGQVVLARIKELEVENVKKNLREFELRVLEQQDSKEYAEVCQQRNLYGFLISKYVTAYNKDFPEES